MSKAAVILVPVLLQQSLSSPQILGGASYENVQYPDGNV